MGRLVVKGVLQLFIIKNQNGRVYPKETLVREQKIFKKFKSMEKKSIR